ncbi:MAG: hypothetical protein JRI61_04665 [Deltaproteobacteria bacterium]|nr:hypothetical protein [Deltaproteobacteria bacterium]
MAYDLEKYREKREKVLGVKKRGISFSAIATIISICIIAGIGFAAVPRAVSYVMTRNFDDAIFKLENSKSWPSDLVTELPGIEGVDKAKTDKHGTRLVVTFDRTVTEPESFLTVFKQKGLKPTLLNRVNHRQRINTLKEEKELEAL